MTALWFNERLYPEDSPQGYAQRLRVERVIHQVKGGLQELAVYQTRWLGRVLVLDGVIQTTEGDEFVYHEMMAHVPLFALGGARDVLIIGGGDGGVLREVLRHDVRSAVMVEIDRTVVDVCAEYMPSLSAGAFDDPRAELIITDGVKYMAQSDRRFDLIVVDSTDPSGPGEVLFTTEFYGNCKKRLKPGGVLVTQNGVPFFQPEEVTTTFRRLKPHFADRSFMVAVVPTYVGGMMALTWATDDPALRRQSEEVIAGRFARAGFATRYYTPAVHVAAFALPGYIGRLMTDAG